MHDVDNSVSVQEIGSVSRVVPAVCVYGVFVGERVLFCSSAVIGPQLLWYASVSIAMSLVDVS